MLVCFPTSLSQKATPPPSGFPSGCIAAQGVFCGEGQICCQGLLCVPNADNIPVCQDPGLAITESSSEAPITAAQQGCMLNPGDNCLGVACCRGLFCSPDIFGNPICQVIQTSQPLASTTFLPTQAPSTTPSVAPTVLPSPPPPSSAPSRIPTLFLGHWASQECADNPQFIDNFGFLCQNWWGNDCNTATSFGYSPDQRDEILINCPAACGICGVLASTLEPTSAPQTKTPTGQPTLSSFSSNPTLSCQPDIGGNCLGLVCCSGLICSPNTFGKPVCREDLTSPPTVSLPPTTSAPTAPSCLSNEGDICLGTTPCCAGMICAPNSQNVPVCLSLEQLLAVASTTKAPTGSTAPPSAAIPVGCAGACSILEERKNPNGASCYCDNLCMAFGSCCNDYGHQCNGEPAPNAPSISPTAPPSKSPTDIVWCPDSALSHFDQYADHRLVHNDIPMDTVIGYTLEDCAQLCVDTATPVSANRWDPTSMELNCELAPQNITFLLT